MNQLVIRPARTADLPDLRRAVVELQEYERRLHATRLPGEQIADAYLTWVQQRRAEKSGAVFVAEIGRAFAGFAAGWIVEDDNIAETADSNRAGYVSALEKAAAMANHASTRTTQLYDRRRDEVSLDEVERIVI